MKKKLGIVPKKEQASHTDGERAPPKLKGDYTMESFQEQLKRFDKKTGSELHDPEYDWMVEAVETRETLSDFEESAKKYNERTWAGRGEIAGLPFIAWSEVQTFKGETRRALSVVDFGDRRIALNADLTNF